MRHWTSDDIPWKAFNASKLDADILLLIKAASLVERNAGDCTRYLKVVFRDEPAFLAVADSWEADEVQHGEILGRYAHMADPDFDFPSRFRRFVEGYHIPEEGGQSVRGSLTGELIARCIVETGTSSMYSALRDATDEPVLKEICHRIAGDEFRHYKMFYALMRELKEREGVHVFRRLMIAVGRIRETDDDELAYAWYAANEPADAPYDHDHCYHAYSTSAFRHYRDMHAERAVNMVMKAVGLNPHGWLGARAKTFAKRKMLSLSAA